MKSGAELQISAFEYAMKILSKRVYAESEIYTKLRKKNYPQNEIKSAIEDCKRYSFINDEAYACDYASLLNSRGCGALLIRRKLMQLQIADEYIEKALEGIAENEIASARNAFDFKLRMLKTEKDKFKKKQKLYAFMVGRGYSFDIIRMLLDDFEMNRSDDEG